jgi:hypothetical protein
LPNSLPVFTIAGISMPPTWLTAPYFDNIAATAPATKPIWACSTSYCATLSVGVPVGPQAPPSHCHP